VSSRNAAVHDIVLHTAVVYDWSEHRETTLAVVAPPVVVAAPESAPVAVAP
jgi:hypothetical protein